MASFSKTPHGFRAEFRFRGERQTKLFPTRREAQLWATKREKELQDEYGGDFPKKTLLDALTRSADEVSPTHKGEAWELVRLKAFERTLPITTLMVELTDKQIIDWRDSRLGTVSPASVLREFKLLNSVLEYTRKEWKWIAQNPAKDVRRPKASGHRDRLITWAESRKVLRALGWTRGPAKSISHSVANCFLLALVTGMRSGEITALKWSNIRGKYAALETSKTNVGRDIPLSVTARRIIAMQEGFDSKLVFGVSASTRDAIFRRAKNTAGVDGFTFHDTRHTAATRLARSGVFDVLTLCKVFGWSDPKMAMVYFNPTANDLADLL